MEETTLKRSANRSIVRVGEHVEKRWHHPSPLARLWDGWRARREARRLAALSERGLRVPRVLEQRGTTLCIEWIQGAWELEHCLRPPLPGLELRLGRWLSQLADAGVRHGDLHPANVLIDAQGEPVLIDMAAVRLGRPLNSAEKSRQLEQLLAGLVESVPTEFCQRLIAAHEPGEDPQARLGFARVQRRASVRAELDRWLRESSRCTRQGRELLARQSLPEPFVRLRYERESEQEMRALWLHAARLSEHGILSARPLRWQQGPSGFVELCLPKSAEALGVRECLEHWAPALTERGLCIPDHSGLKAARDGEGRPWLIGVRRIEELEGRAPWR
jgi:tRNA A-37 threonylcarbamoyl transferase component Bud32